MNDNRSPAQTPTVQIPKADRTDILIQELKQLVISASKASDERADRFEQSLKNQAERLAQIHQWKENIDQRLKSNSMRAQSASQMDMDQIAQIAQERAAREELATKLDSVTTSVTAISTKIDTVTVAQTNALLERFDEVAKNPMVRNILYLAGGAIIAWLSKGHL